MSWKIYCNFKNDIDKTAMEAIELPGIYNDDRKDVKEAIRILVRQKANELRSEGMYIMDEDINIGEVCAVDGYGNYVIFSYYSRRPYNV